MTGQLFGCLCFLVAGGMLMVAYRERVAAKITGGRTK